jgi:high-affinity K+ transport system ATPase subunit B
MRAVLNPPIVSRLADADMQAVPAALARAAQSARELAARTGTPLVVARDGKFVEAVIQLDVAKPGHGVSHKH